ncbi:MAG: hypothetical protein CMK50_03750 [Propionibacteriaceae bacterium]|nr:hypothetical protein [Propionibacteriaceae bacterium]
MHYARGAAVAENVLEGVLLACNALCLLCFRDCGDLLTGIAPLLRLARPNPMVLVAQIGAVGASAACLTGASVEHTCCASSPGGTNTVTRRGGRRDLILLGRALVVREAHTVGSGCRGGFFVLTNATLEGGHTLAASYLCKSLALDARRALPVRRGAGRHCLAGARRACRRCLTRGVTSRVLEGSGDAFLAHAVSAGGCISNQGETCGTRRADRSALAVMVWAGSEELPFVVGAHLVRGAVAVRGFRMRHGLPLIRTADAQSGTFAVASHGRRDKLVLCGVVTLRQGRALATLGGSGHLLDKFVRGLLLDHNQLLRNAVSGNGEVGRGHGHALAGQCGGDMLRRIFVLELGLHDISIGRGT